MTPKLSIIIPLYKTTKLDIMPLLASYGNQYILEENNIKIELLFIYDPTVPISTLGFIEETLQEFNFYDIKFVYSRTTASGAKRNYGIAIASSDYIWFNDQDDWLSNQLSLYRIVQYLEKTKKDHIMILPNYIYNTSIVISRPWMHIIKKDLAIKFKFSEEKEWGADEVFVRALLKYENIAYDEDSKTYNIPFDLVGIYTWNNLNKKSYSVSQMFQDEWNVIMGKDKT